MATPEDGLRAGRAAGADSNGPERTCEVCGAGLTDRRAGAKTCSARCRQRLSRATRRTPRKGPNRCCLVCNATLRRPHARTCSAACRLTLHRWAKGAKHFPVTDEVA